MTEKIVMFWLGQRMSLIEVSSILSAQRVGYSVELFCYQKIANVPNGVKFQDANEIIPRKEFLLYKGSNPALGSNKFRYILQEQKRGIWSDTDVIFLDQINFNEKNPIFGWQDAKLINNAVLYMPPENPVLHDLMTYVSNEYPIPPFYSAKVKEELKHRKNIGQAVHVSEMPWGVWGPNALTYFIEKNKMVDFCSPREVFYPISPKNRDFIFSSDSSSGEFLEKTTKTIHLWNAILKSDFRKQQKNGGSGIPVSRDSFFFKFCTIELGLRL